MGPQDGVDHALRALAALQAQRNDWRAIFIGGGDVLEQMRGLSAELNLSDAVTFTGRIPDADVIRILSSADVCLAPDPKNPLNDLSTMNKIVEYMSLSRPDRVVRPARGARLRRGCGALRESRRRGRLRSLHRDSPRLGGGARAHGRRRSASSRGRDLLGALGGSAARGLRARTTGRPHAGVAVTADWRRPDASCDADDTSDRRRASSEAHATLADALRRQGCEVELMQCWGRRVEGERLPAKLWGRAADVRTVTKEVVRGGFPLVVVHTSHDWN